MEKYRLTIKPSAEKELSKAPKKILRQIVAKVRDLAIEPRPVGSEKLSGDEKYRVRQGDYRIVYSIDDKTRSVEVVRIGHRRDVYR